MLIKSFYPQRKSTAWIRTFPDLNPLSVQEKIVLKLLFGNGDFIFFAKFTCILTLKNYSKRAIKNIKSKYLKKGPDETHSHT